MRSPINLSFDWWHRLYGLELSGLTIYELWCGGCLPQQEFVSESILAISIKLTRRVTSPGKILFILCGCDFEAGDGVV